MDHRPARSRHSARRIARRVRLEFAITGAGRRISWIGRKMDVFELRKRVVDDYQQYITSFIAIRDARVQKEVDENLDAGLLWPEPRIGLNPSFETGGLIDEHVESGLLHPECSKIFRIKPDNEPEKAMRLHRHQLDAIKAASTRANYVGSSRRRGEG